MFDRYLFPINDDYFNKGISIFDSNSSRAHSSQDHVSPGFCHILICFINNIFHCVVLAFRFTFSVSCRGNSSHSSRFVVLFITLFVSSYCITYIFNITLIHTESPSPMSMTNIVINENDQPSRNNSREIGVFKSSNTNAIGVFGSTVSEVRFIFFSLNWWQNLDFFFFFFRFTNNC